MEGETTNFLKYTCRKLGFKELSPPLFVDMKKYIGIFKCKLQCLVLCTLSPTDKDFLTLGGGVLERNLSFACLDFG